MVTVDRYTPAMKEEWDRCAAEARNGTFLFQRGYVDYHADRFEDHSLVFRREGKPVAVLPANRQDRTLVSHGGLTFGGLLPLPALTTAAVLALFHDLTRFLREQGFTRLLYKCVPHIYHAAPAEDDRYALFRHGASLYRRDVSAAIDLRHPLPYQERRRRGVKKAAAAGVEARHTDDFAA